MTNTNRILISPSILSGDFVNMQHSVAQIAEWGGDLVHCDVMDGVYVKNLTFGMPMIAAIKKITKLPLDVHLMITKPERYIDAFIDSGADFLTFHPEASKNALGALKRIQSKGIKSGIVFNPDVSIEEYKHLFPFCDMILVMSVFAGLGGQKFIQDSLERIKTVKKYLDEMSLNIPIEIDGGITEENVDDVIAAGASIIVAGSSVYKSKNPAATIKRLRGITE